MTKRTSCASSARRLFDEDLLHLGANHTVDGHLVSGREPLPTLAVVL